MKKKLPKTEHGYPSGKELLLLVPLVIVGGIVDVICMPFRALFGRKK